MADSVSSISQSVDGLVKILKKASSSPRDKTDAYLTLAQHLQNDMQSVESSLLKHGKDILDKLKIHINHTQSDLALAALLVLGLLLSSTKLVKITPATFISDIVIDLCNLLQSSRDKQAYVRAFWNLSIQNIPNPILSKHIPIILKCLEKHCKSPTSGTVVVQGIQAIRRLCEICPEEMGIQMENWIDILFRELSKSPESFVGTMDTVKSCMIVIHRNKTFSKEYITGQLQKGLAVEINKFFKNGCKIEVIQLFSIFIQVLDESLWDIKDAKNCLTQILLHSFKSKDKEILSAVYDLWGILIGLFTVNDELLARRTSFLLEPLKNRYHLHEDPTIAEKCVKTYWYMICSIGNKINESMDKIILPILQYLFSNQGSRSTPIKNYPSGSADLKILAVEIMCGLFTKPEERASLKGTKLDPFFGPKINFDHLQRNHTEFIKFLSEAYRTCLNTNEALVIQCWVSFLLGLKGVEIKDSLKDIWILVFQTVKRIIDDGLGTVNFVLRVGFVVPVDITIKELETERNTYGLSALFLIETILGDQFIKKKILEHERCFVLYQRMIEVLLCNSSRELSSTDAIFSILIKKSDLLNERISWRLWSTLTHFFNRYVSLTNEINQGSAANYDFSVVHKSLLYPIKYIDLSKLKEAEKDDLMETWSQLYENCKRAMTLLPGISNNLILEEFCKAVSDDYTKDQSNCLDVIIRMLWVVVKSASLDSSTSPVSIICGIQVSSTSRVSNLERKVLDGLASLLHCLRAIITPITENLDPASRQTDKFLIEVLHLIQFFFEQLNSSSQICETLNILNPALSVLLEKSKSQPRLSSHLEKLIESAFSTMKNISTIEYNEQLLNLFETYLTHAFSCKRKSFRLSAVHFWNETFGENKVLTFSSNLKNVLSKCDTPIKPVLEGSLSSKVVVNSLDDSAQFPDSFTPSSPKPKMNNINHISPTKSMGSFLPQHNEDNLKPSSNFLAKKESPCKLNSPSTTPNSMQKSKRNSRRKLPIDLMKEEFVEIKEVKKKSRLLTEHQKEVRKEQKGCLPLMYNTLDQSQDTTLFQSLAVSNSQSQDTSSNGASKVLEDVVSLDSKNVTCFNTDIIPESMPKGEQIETSKTLKVSNVIANKNIENTEEENAKMNIDTSSTSLNSENDTTTVIAESKPAISIPVSPITLVEKSLSGNEEEDNDCIPSSQTQSFSQLRSPYIEVDKIDIRSAQISHEEILENVSILATSTMNSTIVSPQKEKTERKHLESDKENSNSNTNVDKALKPDQNDDKPSEHLQQKNIDLDKVDVKTNDWLSADDHDQYHVKRGVNTKSLSTKNNITNKKTSIKRKRRSLGGITSQSKRKRRSLPNPLREQESISSDISLVEVSNNEKLSEETLCEKTSTMEKEDMKGGDAQDKETEEHEVIVDPIISNQKETFIDQDDFKFTHVMKSGTQISQVEEMRTPTKLSLSCKENPSKLEVSLVPKTQLENEANNTVNCIKSATTFGKDLSVSSTVTLSALGNTLPIFSAANSSPKNIANMSSPMASPVSGILKKRSFVQSPSPPPNTRRVSFQLPEGAVLLEDKEIGAISESPQRNRDKSPKKLKMKNRKNEAPLIYPDLVDCKAPIDKILPSITFSRGVGHLVRAQCATVGHLSSLTEAQVENLPIRSPKVRTVKNALKSFSVQQSRDRDREKNILKSPLPLGKAMKDFSPMKACTEETQGMLKAEMGTPSKCMDVSSNLVTPSKQDAEALPDLVTPSKHDGEFLKPTTLFNNECSIAEELRMNSNAVNKKNSDKNALIISAELENDLQIISHMEVKDGLEDNFQTKEYSGIDKVENYQEDCVDVLDETGEKDFQTTSCVETMSGQTNKHTDKEPLELPASITAENAQRQDCADTIKIILEDVANRGNRILENMVRGNEEEKRTVDELKNHIRLASDSQENIAIDDDITACTSVFPSEEVVNESFTVLESNDKLTEKEQSKIDDSFEKTFGAVNISPIKSDIVSTEGKKEHELETVEDFENVTADIPSMDGITPLVNDSFKKDTKIPSLEKEDVNCDNKSNPDGLSTSIECIPCSVDDNRHETGSKIDISVTSKITSTASTGNCVEDTEIIVGSDYKTIIADTFSLDTSPTKPSSALSKELVSTSSSLLPNINFTNLSTSCIFELAKELDNLKSNLMLELEHRMRKSST